jgi:uncharacterized alpha-E superfamily protein
MMLSRVAERMYWIGRYMERAEDTARMVNTVTEMMLGVPQAASLWPVTIDILGLNAAYRERYGHAEERQTVRFLLADELNPSSIVRSIQNARENARTTREILPNEAWELVNDSYWQVKEQAAKAVSRNHRHEFLNRVVQNCQLLNGMLAGTMSHDSAYYFALVGRNIERADMTTRVLDLGAADLAQYTANTGPTPFANLRWMSVLLCLSGYQMYHQHVQTRVNALEVLNFLLHDKRFPRAVSHCLGAIEIGLSFLPHHDPPLDNLRAVQRTLNGADVAALLKAGLRKFLDRLQVELNSIHRAIETNWFLRDH